MGELVEQHKNCPDCEDTGWFFPEELIPCCFCNPDGDQR